MSKLDVPMMLDRAGGPLTVSELAEKSGAQVQPLRRLPRTGEPAAAHYLGKPFFDWVNENPDRSQQFSNAMP
ncbi:hypothetical protein [Streptomyces sp. NEAU-YJ-81]|uniref:hypothetical protein n=1 Tax=Streptomyces sp. NEAU-YJ-81 TaxID=2820288 RepID=UPI001ABC023E|nr:hypothetical protein [Streptomyces sp. NEAU-YJ-81]MBO3676193.1 hypothetical protein [Streptomyces sp. NEAU-YJ-81]